MPMERFALFLPKDLKASIAKQAKRTGLSLADVIRLACREYLAKHGP